MKKLMITAASAAMIGASFAATPAGQVYDVQLSIKSTAAAKATINNKTNPFLGETKEEVIYRKQANFSWKGLIWGCSCESIDGVWEEAYTGELIEYSSIKGCILWDTKAKEAVYIGNEADINDPESAIGKGFGWDFINAIDKNGKKVEGAWSMCQNGLLCEDAATLFEFRGAGFGNLTIGDVDDCGLNYIKSISGNFAGWMVAPDETAVVNPTGCTFCGYQPGSSECTPAAAWDYCSCEDNLFDEERTAAYGTWKIAYNSSLSKKLSKPLSVSKKGVEGVIVSITDVYNFKSLPLVAAKITAIENAIWQYDPTGCDVLEVALTEAKAAVVKAEAAVEAVSYENLKKAEVAAQAEVNLLETKKVALQSAYQYASEKYNLAKAAVVDQDQYMTTNKWAIWYVNLSKIEEKADGIGLKDFESANENLKGYTLIDAAYATTKIVANYTTISNFCADQKKTLVSLKAAETTAQNNLATADAALAECNAELVVANDALMVAQNNLANIALLQYQATKDLDSAEAKLAVAQAAYDEKGCGEAE